MCTFSALMDNRPFIVLLNYFLFDVGHGLQNHMERFTKYIVDMMKREKLFASQGGHIILAQVSLSLSHTFK